MFPLPLFDLSKCSLAAIATSLLLCGPNPAFAQQTALETLVVSAEVAGRTPSRIGYVLGENRPGSNVSSWLRYAEINAARFWWPGTVWPDKPAAWPGQNGLTRFESERARLRENPDGGIDWPRFREAVAREHGGRPAGMVGDSFPLSELHRMGAAPLLVLSHSRTNYPFDEPGGVPDWHGRWAFWRGVYASAFYLARTYGVERFQIFNEPDHKVNLDLTQSDYLRRLQLGSDAVQAAVSDVNRLDKKSLRAQVSAPVSAGMTAFGARPGRTDKRDALAGWGEMTVAAQNLGFEGKSADNRGLFAAYAFQNYTRTPDTISSRLPAIIEGITATNGGVPIPLIATEMNVSTAAEFAKTEATLDTPAYYAAFGAIAAAYCNAGLSEGYVFRHTQTNNLEGGRIKKNGTHFLDNRDPLKNVLGSTKGGEAARLWIRGFKGGKTRFAVPVLPANLHYLAARDEISGTCSVLLSNLGPARHLSLDLRGWKIPRGALVSVEEVSETHHGDVKSVAILAANGRIELPMSANSVDLLTVRPNALAAPIIRNARLSRGLWQVSAPKAVQSGGHWFLSLRGSSARATQRIRVYGGAGDVANAELLGQVTLGVKSREAMVDVTRYAAARPGQTLHFQTLSDDPRLGEKSFTISAAQLRFFAAPKIR